GVTVRPLINISGHHSFNEVFFDNVRIPDSYRVGETNRGWYHVAGALVVERSGSQAYAGGKRVMEQLTAFAKEQPELMARKPGLRLQLAERAIEVKVGFDIA